MRKIPVALFFLICCLQFVLAQETVDVLPRSETAEAAYLQTDSGRRLPLKLNERNSLKKELTSGEAASVIFTREEYLDCVIPVEPIFLESGFPGDFANLERYYELKFEEQLEGVKVYEVGRSSDKPEQKNYMGTAGEVPLRLDRQAYYDSVRGKFNQVRLLFEKPGYKPYSLEVSAKELVPNQRLPEIEMSPADGLGNLWIRSSVQLVGIGFLGLGALVGFTFLARRKLRFVDREPALSEPRIGAYRKLESVGKGGTAEVFRGLSDDGLEVALKIMLESDLEGDAKERFRREIQASLQYQHEHLATIYDWGETEDGRLYLVTEFLRGETLSQRLKSEPVGAGRDLLIKSALVPVGKALSYLHQQGVVHRDVKPGNIFLGVDGSAKLIDLGLARGAELDGLTRTGVAVGTPYYMSPEQARGDYTAQSDQYALGVIAFEILAGERPYKGNDPVEVFQKHISAPIPNLKELRPDLSLHLVSVLSKMMGKKPEQRFATLEQALEALTSDFGDGFDGDEDTHAFSIE